MVFYLIIHYTSAYVTTENLEESYVYDEYYYVEEWDQISLVMNEFSKYVLVELCNMLHKGIVCTP